MFSRGGFNTLFFTLFTLFFLLGHNGKIYTNRIVNWRNFAVLLLWTANSIDTANLMVSSVNEIRKYQYLDTVDSPQPAKSLKSNTGGVSFCWINIQYAMPFCRKYTSPHCFFCKFANWIYNSNTHGYRLKSILVMESSNYGESAIVKNCNQRYLDMVKNGH